MNDAMTLFFITFVLSYLYHGLGITVGYHRLLSHRSFKVPVWLEYLLVSGGYLCFEGSPIFWVTAHRLHHRYSDQPGDPHSPQDGFWHAFMGWMFKARAKDTVRESQVVCADLWRDGFYRLLDVGHTDWRALVCLFCCVAFRAVIFVLLGPVALTANLAASTLTFASPCLVNSVCHLPGIGYQNFDAKDKSRNVWWVGLLALGEGWHNNHHALPYSARHGLKPHEVDVSWWTIKLMQLLGLARDVRLPKGRHYPDRQADWQDRLVMRINDVKALSRSANSSKETHKRS